MHKIKKLKARSIGLIALLASSLISVPAIAADNVLLRMQTYYGTELDHITKKFAKTVKTETDGAVRVMVFRGEELVKNSEALAAVAKGTLDMSHSCPCFLGGKLDVANLESGLPGAWANYDEAKELFYEKGLLDIVKQSYDEEGVVYLSKVLGSDYDLLSIKPISGLDDLKNMKVRTTPTVAKVFKKLGINTVNLPPSELYVALSTGVLDAVIYGGTLDYTSLKLNEMAKNYTTLNMLTPGWTEHIVINPKKWNKLSPEQQQIVQKASDQMALDIADWYGQGNKKAAETGGFVFNELPASDSASVVAASQAVWDEEAQTSERTAKIVDILRSYAKEKGRL